MPPFVIVSFLALWPEEGEPSNSWRNLCIGIFSDRSQQLRSVGVYVIPNYWYMYTADEMKWCVEGLI
jgi:hypothetical protein